MIMNDNDEDDDEDDDEKKKDDLGAVDPFLPAPAALLWSSKIRSHLITLLS